MRQKALQLIVGSIFGLAGNCAFAAGPVAVDLNQVFFPPTDGVSIFGAIPAQGATFSTSGGSPLGVNQLSNDPGLGDLAVFVANPGAHIDFSYTVVDVSASFPQPTFVVDVLDPDVAGSPPIAAFSHSFSPTTLVPWDIDLSALPAGKVVGLSFTLTWDTTAANNPGTSVAEIDNLTFTAGTVDEPAPYALLAGGAVLGAALSRRRGARPAATMPVVS